MPNAILRYSRPSPRAIRERRELEFDYRKLEAEKPERRRVQPFSLLCVENQWYDRIRSDLRIFHLARIDNPKMLAQRFERPSGFDVTEAFVDPIGTYAGREATEVVLNFRDWAARVAAERTWHLSQKLRQRADGTIELKLTVAITPEFELPDNTLTILKTAEVYASGTTTVACVRGGCASTKMLAFMGMRFTVTSDEWTESRP